MDIEYIYIISDDFLACEAVINNDPSFKIQGVVRISEYESIDSAKSAAKKEVEDLIYKKPTEAGLDEIAANVA